MKFLVISDIHGDTNSLDKLDSKFKEADAVLFAGDFTRFNFPETGLQTLESLCKKHDTIFSVIGNCDEPDFLEELEKRDISVEKTLSHFEGLSFAGSGGATKFTGETPFERTNEELASDFNIVTEQGDASWDNLIVISHNPPKDTKCDKITAGFHVGSDLLREFIEKYKPLAVITGHVHEGTSIDKIENTTIINPGALFEGNYAWLEVKKSNGTWQVTNATLEKIQ